ncbi:hypothetical protein ABEX78_21725 [Priestia megaterium]
MNFIGYITNIVVYLRDEEWIAEIDWRTQKFINEYEKQALIIKSTDCTAYANPNLSTAIDWIVEKASRFGLQGNPIGVALLYKEDAENPDFPAPENYLELLKREANKRGWVTYDQLTIRRK